MRLHNITVKSKEKFKTEEICTLHFQYFFFNWHYVHILVFPHG